MHGRLRYNQVSPESSVMSPVQTPGQSVSPVSPLSQTVHDLRQPLSTIEACVFCLRTMLVPDPEVEEYLERIEQQVFEASRILGEACRVAARNQAAERTNSTTASVK